MGRLAQRPDGMDAVRQRIWAKYEEDPTRYSFTAMGRAIGKNHSYMQQYLSLIGTGRRTSAWRRASRSPSSLGYQNENCGYQDRRVRIIVVLITAFDPAHAPVISFGSPHGIGDHKRVG